MNKGFHFQIYVFELFKKLGYFDVELGYRGADGGVDIAMESEKTKYIVECKNWKKKVNARVVTEVFLTIMFKHFGKKGIIVISNYFTKTAKQCAALAEIKLINIDELERLAGIANTPIGNRKDPVERQFPIPQKYCRGCGRVKDTEESILCKFCEHKEKFGLPHPDVYNLPSNWASMPGKRELCIQCTNHSGVSRCDCCAYCQHEVELGKYPFHNRFFYLKKQIPEAVLIDLIKLIKEKNTGNPMKRKDWNVRYRNPEDFDNFFK